MRKFTQIITRMRRTTILLREDGNPGFIGLHQRSRSVRASVIHHQYFIRRHRLPEYGIQSSVDYFRCAVRRYDYATAHHKNPNDFELPFCDHLAARSLCSSTDAPPEST